MNDFFKFHLKKSSPTFWRNKKIPSLTILLFQVFPDFPLWWEPWYYTCVVQFMCVSKVSKYGEEGEFLNFVRITGLIEIYILSTNSMSTCGTFNRLTACSLTAFTGVMFSLYVCPLGIRGAYVSGDQMFFTLKSRYVSSKCGTRISWDLGGQDHHEDPVSGVRL